MVAIEVRSPYLDKQGLAESIRLEELLGVGSGH